MAKTVTRPAKLVGDESVLASELLWPLEKLRHEIDRVFEDFSVGTGPSSFASPSLAFSPLLPRENLGWPAFFWGPLLDIAETDNDYEISAKIARYGREKHRGEICRRRFDY
jgi:hypothetical protein